MTAELAVHAGLFLAAFLAATILPAQSEALLVGLLLSGHSPVSLVAVASAGNILGSVLNWLLGRGIAGASSRWAPQRGAMLERAQHWYRRYGKWSLLLSWLPVVGDPLTVVAGMLREPLPVFLLFVAVAKTGRYLVLTAITLT